MSPLEIVLTIILSTLLLLTLLYLMVLKTNIINRKQLFEVINEDFHKDSIVFFGDSLTDFYPIQDFFPAKTIYNRGIAGDKTTDLLKRIDNVIELQPRKLFLQIGTNDLGKKVKIRTIVANIEKIVNRLKTEVPHIQIYIISLYPISHKKGWLSPFFARRRTNKSIVKINEDLQKLCATEGFVYIDVFSSLVDTKGQLNSLYTIEGLHISGKGYRVISEILRPYID